MCPPQCDHVKLCKMSLRLSNKSMEECFLSYWIRTLKFVNQDPSSNYSLIKRIEFAYFRIEPFHHLYQDYIVPRINNQALNSSVRIQEKLFQGLVLFKWNHFGFTSLRVTMCFWKCHNWKYMHICRFSPCMVLLIHFKIKSENFKNCLDFGSNNSEKWIGTEL